MRLAQLQDGVVVNAIEVDPARIPDWATDWPELVEGAGIGWAWDGEAFTPPPGPPAELAPAPAPPISPCCRART